MRKLRDILVKKYNLAVELRLARLQTADDIRKHADRIRSAFGAYRVAVVEDEDRPAHVTVRILRRNPLADGVPAADFLAQLAEPHDMARLLLGVDEVGENVALDMVLRPHALAGGTTGGGKSGVVNAIIAASLTATPRAHLVLVDPKRVELGHWAPAAARVATDPDDLGPAVADALAVMRARYAWMEAHGVKNLNSAPQALASLGGPLLIVVDELAEYLTLAGKEGGAALSSIAQLGRAAATYLLVATQNPKAELFSKGSGTETLRSNLNNLIALRVARRADSDVILGQGEASDGLDASRLPSRYPGCAYIAGRAEMIRAAWLSEEDIADLAAEHPATLTLDDLAVLAAPDEGDTL